MKKVNDIMNNKCQVFTPKDYVNELLDSVGYCKNIFGKKILENSCGDGNILTEIVSRYITEAIELKYSKREIRIGLSQNIFGFEIDIQQYNKCIFNLNKIALDNGIKNVNWEIYNEDYLQSNLKIKFDFIVGNPPYITYSDLSLKERNYIRENYPTCERGKFDYCYAFIEHGINSLSPEGKMSYLIPSSIFKTVFGNRLRDFIKQYVCQIIDYTRKKIFDDALVKSAIIVIDKKNISEKINYLDMSSGNEFNILKTKMKDKWVFSNEFNIGDKRFGEYFRVAHVVATLLNKAYVIEAEGYNETEDCYQIGDINVEKDMVMPTATPRTMRHEKTEKIIFPYYYIDNQLVRFKEEEFSNLYPGAYKYLNKFKEQLTKRKSDNRSKWFEYGRSQALLGIKCEKLLISTIITDKIFVYKLSDECIPYAGVFISVREDNKEYDLDFAKRILESKDFMNYINKIGINISGSSLRITSKDIENYRFKL